MSDLKERVIEKGSMSFSKVQVIPWAMCALAALFYCYEYLLRILPSVMIPDLMQTYDISAAALSSMVAYYYYAYTPMQIPVGVLIDKYRVKYLLIFNCFLCVLGTYIFVITDSIILAKMGRFLVGFGSAFAFVGVLKMATIWLPAKRLALVSGLTTTLGMLGAMFGNLMLTNLVEKSGWQFSIYIAAIIGVALVLALVFFLSDRGCDIISTKRKEQEEHTNTDWANLYAGARKILSNKQIWCNGLAGAMLYCSLSVFAEVWGNSYLEQAHSCSPKEASRAVGMVFLGWAFGSPFVGWFADFVHQRVGTMRMGAFGAFLCISLVLYLSNLPLYVIYIALFGYGFFCSVEVLAFAIGIDHSPKALAGTAVTVTNMLIMSSGMILQPLAGKLLDFYGNVTIINNVSYYSVEDYRFALSILTVGLLLAILMLSFVKETKDFKQ